MPEDYFEVLAKKHIHDWPVRADIDITNLCNHKCTYCFSQYQRSEQPRLNMDVRLFQNLLQELVRGGTKSIRFCGGGEPLTHPEAEKIFTWASQLPVHITLLTNGDLLSGNYQKIFLRPFTYIRFSVDSYDAPTRSRTHGTTKNSYDMLLNNITNYNSQRVRSGLLETTKVGATYLLHPENVNDLFRAVQQLKDAGVDHLSFRQIKGKSFAVRFSNETEIRIFEELRMIKEKLEDEKFQIFVTHRLLTDVGSYPSKYFSHCNVSRTRVIIETDGAVQMCPRARGERSWRTLGTIDSDTSFEEIWNSGKRCDQQQQAPDKCEDCIDISSNRTLNEVMSVLSSEPLIFRRTMK